jgi:glucose/arabinose dehydrogenase
VDNAGLGTGDRVNLQSTGVSCSDRDALVAKRVSVRCVPRVALPDESVVFNTFEQPQIRVVTVTKGLSDPWGMAFLPDGGILVTERAGRLRLIRDGVLDPEPIRGIPEVATLGDIALHPRFVDNNLVYLTYRKPRATVALARGRFDGAALRDVRDIFVANSSGPSRIVFAPDGTLYMTLGGTGSGPASWGFAQDPSAHAGKVLRLRDDGSVPDDNPFVGRAGYMPEIFSLGHRNQEGATIHPETGALWTSEHGPQGGDEVNVIVAGRNYGWPVVSYGREYEGPFVAEQPRQAGMEEPMIVWIPSIAPSGMTFYTGDRFPAWQGNLFVAGMQTGNIAGTGHLERIVLNEDGEELRREWLLAEFKQRIRDVRQGPEGLLYVLTEGAVRFGRGTEGAGALLRIEPVRPN